MLFAAAHSPTRRSFFVDRCGEKLSSTILGETHHLREHWEFAAALMSELYDDGFRQLLIEAPHMASWPL